MVLGHIIMKLIDSEVGVVVRVGMMFFLCALSIFIIISGAKGQSRINPQLVAQTIDNGRLEALQSSVNTDRILIEHRFSILETKMDAVKEVQDSNQTIWRIVLFMVSGLLGEKGIQIYKNRVPKVK